MQLERFLCLTHGALLTTTNHSRVESHSQSKSREISPNLNLGGKSHCSVALVVVGLIMIAECTYVLQ